MNASAEMPRYRCHKEVHALKIAKLDQGPNASMLMTPAEPGYAPFPLDRAFVAKHEPQVGGYYVIYADGYRSFSPAQAFEEGYTRIEGGQVSQEIQNFLAQHPLARRIMVEAAHAAAEAQIEACARIADGFTCGACGMDGKAGAAIRARRI